MKVTMWRMRRARFVLWISLACWFTLTLMIYNNTEQLVNQLAFPVLKLFSDLDPSRSPGVQCFFENKTNCLPEISSVEPNRSTSIFFHHTSCESNENGGVVLTPRQACSVESAAKMNPDSEVYLLYTSPVMTNNVSQWSAMAQQLLKYNNVRIMHLNFATYFLNTPLEAWYRSGALKNSLWPRSHASDVLRFVTLWKYGGTYLDLDVVTTRSFSEIRNFVSPESEYLIGSAVLNFAADGIGHSILLTCLNELASDFRGYDWVHNGPDLITRVLRHLCKVQEVYQMSSERCRDFDVRPPGDFYSISWREWRILFDEAMAKQTMGRIGDAYAVHFWNKLSHGEVVRVGSTQPYALIAQKFCPRVYSNCGETF